MSKNKKTMRNKKGGFLDNRRECSELRKTMNNAGNNMTVYNAAYAKADSLGCYMPFNRALQKLKDTARDLSERRRGGKNKSNKRKTNKRRK